MPIFNTLVPGGKNPLMDTRKLEIASAIILMLALITLVLVE